MEEVYLLSPNHAQTKNSADTCESLMRIWVLLYSPLALHIFIKGCERSASVESGNRTQSDA